MELKEFIANFAALFDDIDASEIQADTIFYELDGWSSLSALTLIDMVNEAYGISINGIEIRKADTVEDLFNLVKSKV